MSRELDDLREQLAAWRRWQHAWVYGGERQWPGMEGVVDPYDTVEDLAREIDEMRGELATLRQCQDEHYGNLMAAMSENTDLLALLLPIWERTHAEAYRPELDSDWRMVAMLIAELRAIAALFVEDKP